MCTNSCSLRPEQYAAVVALARLDAEAVPALSAATGSDAVWNGCARRCRTSLELIASLGLPRSLHGRNCSGNRPEHFHTGSAASPAGEAASAGQRSGPGDAGEPEQSDAGSS